MAEIKIDVDGIKNKVILPLNKAKIELELAANSLSEINYSPDYYKFTNLNKVQSVLSQRIRNVKTDVSNINKWLENIEKNFQCVEKINNTLVNSIVAQGLSSKINKTGGNIKKIIYNSKKTNNNKDINYVISDIVAKGKSNHRSNFLENKLNKASAKISNAWNETCAKVSDGVDSVCAKVSDGFGSICSNTKKTLRRTCAKVSDVWDSACTKTSDGFRSICSIGKKIENDASSMMRCAGSYISLTWDSLCTNIYPKIWKGLQSTGASIINFRLGFDKGLFQFGGALVDFFTILGTGIASVGTGIYDGASYLYSNTNGITDKWESKTKAMWGRSMEFVAEDYVEEAYEKFYKDTAVGKWLNKHAIGGSKSDGIVTNIASGLGYVSGVIALTVLTLGVGSTVSAGSTTLSFTATSASVAGTSAVGKYTQEAWKVERDSSWDGIERLYKKGDISKEEYNTFIAIREMTDEQWAEIKKAYEEGNISKVEFEQIKQIREMPKDWKTFEKGFKGIIYGVTNGAWEAVQWYIGGKLANWTIKGGSQIASSTIRVGVDSILSAADTPLRTVMDVVSYGKTWNNSWKDRGGWKSLSSNLVIGASLSLFEEFLKAGKSIKTPKNLKDSIANNVDVNLNKNNLKNEILSKIPDTDDEVLISKSIYEELNKKVHYDFGYKFGDEITKQQILDETLNFDNLNKNSLITCKGWSELYEEILKEKGIDCKIIKADNGNHWWVEIITKDGRYFDADATDVIGGSVDLINSKIGSQTKGFFEINPTQAGQRPQSIIKTQGQIDQITEIDKQLGYADKKGYRIDKIADVNKMFKSNILKKSKLSYKQISNLFEISEGIDGYEAFGYFRKLREANIDVCPDLWYIKNGDRIETLCSVFYTESNPPIYQIYSETMNKVTFTNMESMMEYINALNPLKRP